MAEPTALDRLLERSAKIVTIVVPSVIAIASLLYTVNKDTNDIAQRRAEAAHREIADRADADQKNISNLLPLLKSDKENERLLGIELFTAQAKRGQASLDLLPTIERLRQASTSQPIQAAIENATTAAAKQQTSTCRNLAPAGVYMHVEDKSQLSAAKELGSVIAQRGFVFQGAQMIDVAPRQTEIRYFAAGAKQGDLDKIAGVLSARGITPKRSDISYLLKGCDPRAVYEVWIAADAKLN